MSKNVDFGDFFLIICIIIVELLKLDMGHSDKIYRTHLDLFFGGFNPINAYNLNFSQFSDIPSKLSPKNGKLVKKHRRGIFFSNYM